MSYQLTDSFGRTINNLRVSVTDQCNFRCIYCMPEEGMIFQPREEILTFEEITRFVGIVTGLGISKLRLTGGEPTVRKDLPVLVRMLAETPGVHDMAMTTNGFLLKKMSRDLREAGLPRINVSLDTLDQEKFKEMTRRDVLHKVLDGLEEATRHFQLPIKINVVAMKGYTEDELLDFAKLARTGPYQVRFIEFMPLDADRSWTRDQVLDGAEIIERIGEQWPLDAVKRPDQREPADLFRFRDGRARSDSSRRSANPSAAAATGYASRRTASSEPACSRSMKPISRLCCGAAPRTRKSRRRSSKPYGTRNRGITSTNPISSSRNGPCPPSADSRRSS